MYGRRKSSLYFKRPFSIDDIKYISWWWDEFPIISTNQEKRGLAYSIYSFLDFYSDVGLFGIYAGTDLQNLGILQSILRDELKRVVDSPIKKSDLNKIKNQLKGNLVLALESTSRRMSRLAKNEIYFEDYIGLDALIAGIDEVNESDVQAVAQNVIKPDDFTTVVLRPKHT